MGILILALSLAFASTGVQSTCTEYEAEECMKPITDLRTKLGISAELAYFPVYSLNDEQLGEYCRADSRVTSCLDGLYGCDDEFRYESKGLKNTFVFLCIDTLQEYKTHQQCYAEKAVIDGILRCATQTEESSSNSYVAEDPFCGSVKDSCSCIRNAVETECGKEAADWQVTYVKTFLQPYLDLFNCNTFPKQLTWQGRNRVSNHFNNVLVRGRNRASNHFNYVLTNRKI